MNRNETREFVNRDWEFLSNLDRTYWAKEYRQNGSTVMQKASQALWQHMKSIRPEWPDSHERRRDLDNHIALKKLIDQAADGLSPR